MSLLDGLTAYYKLDDIGNQFRDSSGNGHHSTEVVNVTQNETGKVGKCVTINGNYGQTYYSYINLENNSVFDFPNGLTISAWVYITMDATDDTIVSKNNGSNGTYNTVPYSFDVSYAYIRFRTYSDPIGWTSVGTDDQYSFLNNWCHVAVTTDLTETKLYFNGQIVKTGVGLDIYGNRNSTDLLIGHYVAWTTYMYGKIDELMMWGRPLFPTEIEAVYNLGVSGQTLIRDKTKFVSGKNSGPGKLPSIVDLYGEDLITWNNFQILMKKSVDAGSIFENPVVSTYSLVYTTASDYYGCVLGLNGDIHFVPHRATVGQKVNCYTGVVSTYSLVATIDYGYVGGVLAPNGDIHFVSNSAGYIGQKINANGIVSTYNLISNFFCGGIVAPNGDIHFVPLSATVGQKIDVNGVVSTYSLVYTTEQAYNSGVLAPDGSIHFIPLSATVGQKIDVNGVVSTYSLVYTTEQAYNSGVLAPDGSIHFIPLMATVGQKVDINGIVSTYSLIETAGYRYVGGVLAPNGDIHFVPNAAPGWGQKIDKNGIVSTYSISAQYYCRGGVLAPTGDIYFSPYGGGVGTKLSTFSAQPFSMAMCCSPFLNKF